MEVFTPNQDLLIKYLWSIKTPPATGLLIAGMLWKEEATIEMLEYIAKTRESDPKKLHKKAMEIAEKYPSDVIEEWCPTKSEAAEFFDLIIGKLKETKIKAIFSLGAPLRSRDMGVLTYTSDSSFYIMFEDERCLKIDYYTIDGLGVQFGELSPYELEEYNKLKNKDLFNITADEKDFSVSLLNLNHSFKLDYGYIESVSMNPVTWKYSTWVDDDIEYVEPTEETFNEIKFTMSNGKSFIICTEDAESDGDMSIWSDDTEETMPE